MEPIKTKLLYNKLKWRIIPLVGFLYFFNGLDRANVSFAALTMNKELGITAAAFGTISSMFFLAYAIFQVPSNVLLKKFGASKIIPTIACLWGVFTALSFFAQTPTQLTICRFMIGVAEAGFYPGMMYYFTLWFPSRERASVIALFMMVGSFASIIGSPLAGIIVQYTHWLGFSGWRWLFMIEGLPPAILALFGYILMKNTPEDAKWLSKEEKTIIRADLEAEKALTTVKTAKVGLSKIVLNGMLWKMAMIYTFVQITTMIATMWMPTLIKSFPLGLSTAGIGYLMMIPAIASTITVVIVGNHSDKTGERKWHAIIPMLALAASLLLMSLPFGGLTYKIIILVIYGCCLTSWYGPFWTMPSVFLSPEILAISVAFINSCSAIGGFLGNMVSGNIASQYGSTGVFILMGIAVLVSVVLILSLDFKKMKQVDQLAINNGSGSTQNNKTIV